MKHKSLNYVKNNINDTYNVQCIFGNIIIKKIILNNKEIYNIDVSLCENKYTLSLIRRYSDNYTKTENLTYKSLQDAINAIEKSCNDYYNNEIKFWFH